MLRQLRPDTLAVMAGHDGMRLVLWDIDHTLIETRGVGREIYERIFPSATGQPLRDLATVHGRTELDIIHDTLQLHSIDPTDDTVAKVAAALAEGYRAAVDELKARGRVLPGVWPTLEAYAATSGTHQSVLTGNTTDVARIKVETFGLDRYLNLALGAYGDDHHDRSQLVAIACDRATYHLDTTITAEHVTIIGDTPNDVQAALATGTHIIAVATGRYSVDDLRAAGAPTVVAGLTEQPQDPGISGTSATQT